MKNTIVKLVFMGLMMGLAVFQGSSVFAQEEIVSKTINLTGKLVAVDLEKSTITVEQVIEDKNEGGNQVVLFVESSTTIMKAEEAVTLGDLVVEEMVIVEGMVNEAGNLIAWNIQVE